MLRFFFILTFILVLKNENDINLKNKNNYFVSKATLHESPALQS